MVDIFHDNWIFAIGFKISLLGLLGVFIFWGSQFLPQFIQTLLSQAISPNVGESFQQITAPYKRSTGWVITLFCSELFLLLMDVDPLIEILNSLALTLIASWLASQLLRQFFDIYLLDVAVKSGRRANSESLIVGKFIANFLVIVLAIILFAQTHQINVFGLVASLGVGGLAVAFAAQKTLEQVLGGVVLYLDQPFMVDDYIGLPDGTFGRVESIGLRSTKIRTSGKGTVVIVPNNSLTQMNIENFTGAKKVMAIVNLTFYKDIASKEQAFIRQIILDSTQDIFGLDSQSTDIAFREVRDFETSKKTQVQITFFILGSTEVSMDLRRQLLGIATQSITQKLKEYGVAFDIESPTIYVESPITV